jgi:hypothetical protein
MSADVQKWLDGEVLRGWTTSVKGAQGQEEEGPARIRPGGGFSDSKFSNH